LVRLWLLPPRVDIQLVSHADVADGCDLDPEVALAVGFLGLVLEVDHLYDLDLALGPSLAFGPRIGPAVLIGGGPQRSLAGLIVALKAWALDDFPDFWPFPWFLP
jgi:hypothetical protein